MLKGLILLCAITLTTGFAKAEEGLECADQAVKAATEKNYKTFGASTGSCGAKLLTAGTYREAYLVCVSDETDPSEWIVVLKTPSKKGQKCKVEFADTQYDSSTPNFETEDGLLDTVECSVSNGDDDAKVYCK